MLAWLPANETANLPSASPQFWAGQKLTWSIMARVDGKTYSLFGVPNPGSGVEPASVISGSFTATHTTFVVTAGNASIVLDFLSPVSPNNLERQSYPFSYLTTSVSGFGGAEPNVQIYSDIDNSWTGQFGWDVASSWGWSQTAYDTFIFTFSADGTATYSEVGDMVQWGTVVYATQPYRSNLTQQIGDMAALRADFATNGSVSGPWDWAPGSVIAFSHDLGDVNGPDSPSNVTFTIGYVRDEAINYLGNSRANYWRGAGCDDINCAAVHVLLDYESADAEARVLDATIAAKANAAAGSKYADILALSTRQAFGSMDVTIPHNSLDTSDVMVFMKEISRYQIPRNLPLNTADFL